MSEHAVPPHVHSFPACECGQTITSLLDTLSDTMRVQARALAAVQQRVETAERERNEALKIMVSSKLEPCTIHNAFQPGCVSCIVKKAMEADTLRADLGRAVEALKEVADYFEDRSFPVRGHYLGAIWWQRVLPKVDAVLSHPAPPPSARGRK